MVGLVVLLLVREEGPDDVSKLGKTDRGIAEQIEKGSRIQAKVVATVNIWTTFVGPLRMLHVYKKCGSKTRFDKI